MTGPISPSTDSPIRGEEDLLDTFRAGAKKPAAWGVGLEYERLGVDRATVRAAPYSGPHGVEQVLERMAATFGWERLVEAGRVIGLERADTRIALEPGGQLELSAGVRFRLRDVRDEVARHLREVSEVSSPLGLAWITAGLQPISRIEDIEWVPKARYGVMAPYLAQRGRLSHHMMKGTAGVQLNFDYADEEDAAEKIRTASAASSIITAAVANSPISENGLNGFLTRRTAIWLETDADRCGILDLAFENRPVFRAYMNYALDVPLMFVLRSGRYVVMNGLTFRRFLRDGYQGLTATLSDWTIHLTTIFTEVRLKSYIEVRGMDSVDPDLVLSLAALWKGILYDPTARRRAWDLTAGLSMDERRAFHRDVCVRGPEASIKGASARDLALELVRIGRQGLEAISGESAVPADEDEGALMAPLEASLRGEGACPAARWALDWRRAGNPAERRFVEKAERAERAFLGGAAAG